MAVETGPTHDDDDQHVISAAPSPHEEALAEAGKAMLIESVAAGREFCKFMIGVATGAVPIYLGLLEFALPGHLALSREKQIIATVPVLVLLLAATLFALGYMPTTGKMSLDVLEDVEKERSDSIKRRHELGSWGFALFVKGVLIGSMVTIFL